MQLTIIILFVAAIFLLVLSFFQKDRAKDIEKQVENVSIQLMQEMYQLKKKVSLLEEEALVAPSLDTKTAFTEKKLTRDDVLTMHEDGYSVSEIAEITNRAAEEIESLLSNHN
ncbi:hypothetical protein SAMN05421736_102213 [Evansella caseinilytica]|uniref:Uncharacterized protein n=1 Tax=Evansella caseinilytica TaxID=1503961 RepID=A0A1H3KP27_9BACI|nr:hypothetical protein [Evansella caseinilytica]SDY53912.1 hypothetical protein SAMN05421736_102213 [Evansella caseinilytica]